MFLIDDLLGAPFKGLLWIFREIHNAAEEEMTSEAEAITHALTDLYMQLETGQITEEEFTAAEKRLLDRLDEISASEESAGADNEDEGTGPKEAQP